MATPPVLTTPKTRAKQQKVRVLSPLQKQLIVGFLLLCFFGIVGTATWYVTRIEALQIDTVTVAGGFTISHEAVEGAVWNELKGEYLKLIPHTFRYTYPEESIISALKSFPRMKQSVVERDGSTLNVAFEEYVPYALWCEYEADETCLFIDSAGYAFSEAPNLSGTALLRFVRNADAPALGTNVFQSSFLRDVSAFGESLERELGFFVTHVHAEGDYDINFRISGGGVLKVSQNQSFEESLTNLKAILGSEEFAHIEPGNFQYIDLRFGDKVFVNEELNVATTTASSSQPEIMTLTESPVIPVAPAATSSEVE